jgi:hypothetical protein
MAQLRDNTPSHNTGTDLVYSLDLTDPYQAYMFGFIQADGHLYQTTRNRGKLQLEVQVADELILERFAALIPFTSSIVRRTRRTNFAAVHSSAMLRVYDKKFRDALVSAGMERGKKATSISVPSRSFSKVDYFRGVVDADGSLGLTGSGFPFVSLVTSSSLLADAYLRFLCEVTGQVKTSARNKRDGVFNIVVYKEDAQVLATTLYYDSCLALTRKKEAASLVLSWTRPKEMRKVDFARRSWTSEEDSYILGHTVDESAESLGRTRQSIKMRLWRLRG